MRARSAVLCGLAAALVASCGGSGTTAPEQSGNNNNNNSGGTSGSVIVGNNSYTPSALPVNRGATVTWQWDACSSDGYGGQQCVQHSVTFDDGGPGAGLRSEGTFQRTFGTAGNYTYYCTAHGRAAMSGSIAVQ